MATRYNYTGGIITDGLVLNLDAAKRDSYPGSGTTWYDISGNNNNGTLTNGPTYTGVSKDAAIVFDGVDDYVNLPNNITFGADPFTLRSVFYLTNYIDSNAEHGLYQFAEGNYPNDHSVALTVFQNLSTGARGKIRFLIRDTTSNENNLISDSIILQTGSWYDVCAVRDENTAYIYLNGSLLDSQTSGNNMNIETPTLSTIGVTAGLNRHLIGKVAQSSIYSRALTQTEITQNFNALRGRYGI